MDIQSQIPWDSQSFCWIPRFGNLMWGLEPSQQYENFFSIIVLQFVVCPPGPLWWGYRLYGRANGNHLQEDLCHTLCLPGWLLLVPLSPRKATADPHLCRRPSNTENRCSFPMGLGAHKVLFVPFKSLWQVWGLILT